MSQIHMNLFLELFGGLFTVVSEVVVTILFFVGKKAQVCKLFVILSKSFCNCNQL